MNKPKAKIKNATKAKASIKSKVKETKPEVKAKRKTIELSAGSAIRVEPVKVNGTCFVSIRRMYKKKGDKEWSHTRKGLTVPLDSIPEVLKAIKRMASAEESEFTEVNYE